MLDVPMIDNVGDMLQMAVMSYNIPPKALAMQAKCSTSHIYSAMSNMRSLPRKALNEIAKNGVLGAATVAMHATGFSRLFAYLKVDRHVQSMIVMCGDMDEKVADLRDKLPKMLVNKNCRNDLSDDEVGHLYMTAKTILDRITMDLNFVSELEKGYGLQLAGYMEGKEKPPVLEHRRL